MDTQLDWSPTCKLLNKIHITALFFIVQSSSRKLTAENPKLPK